MRKLLTTLGILTLATAARFTFPATAQAGDLVIAVSGGGDVTGKWGQVCCGGACIGQDYCLGNGTYTCCK
jgi:hypothetical protein